jgi:hypothetical protein
MANPNKAVALMGLVEAKLLEFFDPDPVPPVVPPLGGGTTTVWHLSGDVIAPPPWVIGEDGTCETCDGCGPYLWMRLAQRWRQGQSQNMTASAAVIPKCGQARGVTIEVGIARCHPLDGDPEVYQNKGLVLLDDSWRLDLALCAALKEAERLDIAKETGVGTGSPEGPEGMVLTWAQSAYAQF